MKVSAGVAVAAVSATLALATAQSPGPGACNVSPPTVTCGDVNGKPVTFNFSPLVDYPGYPDPAGWLELHSPDGAFIFYLNLGGLPDVGNQSPQGSFAQCTPSAPAGGVNPWYNQQIAAQAENNGGSDCYPIGAKDDLTDSSKWSYDSANNIITITGVSSVPADATQRQSNIVMRCSCGGSTASSNGEEPGSNPATYDFDISTPVVCPAGMCGAPGGQAKKEKKDKKIGWTLVGLSILGVSMYIGGGVYVNHKKFGKELNKEALPHLEFWQSLPGLVKDGVAFSITKIKGLRGGAYDSL